MKLNLKNIFEDKKKGVMLMLPLLLLPIILFSAYKLTEGPNQQEVGQSKLDLNVPKGKETQLFNDKGYYYDTSSDDLTEAKIQDYSLNLNTEDIIKTHVETTVPQRKRNNYNPYGSSNMWKTQKNTAPKTIVKYVTVPQKIAQAPVYQPKKQTQRKAIKPQTYSTLVPKSIVEKTEEKSNLPEELKVSIHGDRLRHNGSITVLTNERYTLADGTEIPLNSFIQGVVTFKQGRIEAVFHIIQTPKKNIKCHYVAYNQSYRKGFEGKSTVPADIGNQVTDDILSGVNTSQGVAGSILKGGLSGVKSALKRKEVKLYSNMKLILQRY